VSQNLEQSLKNITLIAFDLETSGKYPLEAEICEIAATKWRAGEIVDEYQTLVKPSHLMSKEVIEIHHISNEMVSNAPQISEVISEFRNFVEDGYMVAHHSPFDMGFLTIEFERAQLSLPQRPVFCSSLLSRKLIPESPNHRLQTLIQFLTLDGGTAHRALDDAKACLQLCLKCFERLGANATLDEAFAKQGRTLEWPSFSMAKLQENPTFELVIEAILGHRSLNLTYKGGSRPGKARRVYPMGLVRNPNGDFLVAKEEGDSTAKRYLLQKITKAAN